MKTLMENNSPTKHFKNKVINLLNLILILILIFRIIKVFI
jgi:hypothetical protein